MGTVPLPRLYTDVAMNSRKPQLGQFSSNESPLAKRCYIHTHAQPLMALLLGCCISPPHRQRLLGRYTPLAVAKGRGEDAVAEVLERAGGR